MNKIINKMLIFLVSSLFTEILIFKLKKMNVQPIPCNINGNCLTLFGGFYINWKILKTIFMEAGGMAASIASYAPLKDVQVWLDYSGEMLSKRSKIHLFLPEIFRYRIVFEFKEQNQ